MRLLDGHLRAEIHAKGCDLPPEERARLEAALVGLGEAVKDLPDPVLRINLIYHPQSEAYHVELRLRLPGRTIRTGATDPSREAALQRGIQRTIHRTDAYRAHPDREALATAERREALDREVIAPEASDAGPLAETAAAGDYRGFRIALANYEEWLRKRAGRLVQRRPEAQARLGQDLLLGDVVEEVYLTAFEEFTRRPTAVPLHAWLEGLIDPSISLLLRHPEEEGEAASLARTLRETPTA